MHLGSNEESPRDVRIHQNALSYRADIDGIRALAVLLVLFFHVGFDWAPGGYVGVDVFFVVSGYLINLSRRCQGDASKARLLRIEYERLSTALGTSYFVDSSSVLCKRDFCDTIINGNPLFRDKSHLTVYGSEYCVNRLKPMIAGRLLEE